MILIFGIENGCMFQKKSGDKKKSSKRDGSENNSASNSRSATPTANGEQSGKGVGKKSGKNSVEIEYMFNFVLCITPFILEMVTTNLHGKGKDIVLTQDIDKLV